MKTEVKAQAIKSIEVSRFGQMVKVYEQDEYYDFTKDEDGNVHVTGNRGVGVFSPIEFTLKFNEVEVDTDEEEDDEEYYNEDQCPCCVGYQEDDEEDEDY